MSGVGRIRGGRIIGRDVSKHGRRRGVRGLDPDAAARRAGVADSARRRAQMDIGRGGGAVRRRRPLSCRTPRGGRWGGGWPNGQPRRRATRMPLGQKRMRKGGRRHRSRGWRGTGSSAPAEATAGQVLASAALASIALPAEIDPAKLSARFICFEQAIRHLVAALGVAAETGCDSAPRPRSGQRRCAPDVEPAVNGSSGQGSFAVS